MTPQISFIVPVYNSQMYLPHCVDSIIEQTYCNIEIILIDDGSSDESSNICDRYVLKDKRVIVIHQQNKGVSAARNMGIAVAKGQWICFVDADDYISKDYASLVINNTGKADIIFFTYSEVTGKKICEYKIKQTLEHLDKKKMQFFLLGVLNRYHKCEFDFTSIHVTGVCGKAYRKDMLAECKIEFPLGIISGEDSIFNLLAFDAAKNGLLIGTSVYYYRKNELSVTRRYNPQLSNSFLKLLPMMRKWAFGKDNIFIKEYYLRAVSCFMFVALQDFCHPQNLDNYKKRRSQFIQLRNTSVYEEAFNAAKLIGFSKSKAIMCLLCKHRMFTLLCIINKFAKSL